MGGEAIQRWLSLAFELCLSLTGYATSVRHVFFLSSKVWMDVYDSSQPHTVDPEPLTLQRKP